MSRSSSTDAAADAAAHGRRHRRSAESADVAWTSALRVPEPARLDRAPVDAAPVDAAADDAAVSPYASDPAYLAGSPFAAESWYSVPAFDGDRPPAPPQFSRPPQRPLGFAEHDSPPTVATPRAQERLAPRTPPAVVVRPIGARTGGTLTPSIGVGVRRSAREEQRRRNAVRGRMILAASFAVPVLAGGLWWVARPDGQREPLAAVAVDGQGTLRLDSVPGAGGSSGADAPTLISSSSSGGSGGASGGGGGTGAHRLTAGSGSTGNSSTGNGAGTTGSGGSTVTTTSESVTRGEQSGGYGSSAPDVPTSPTQDASSSSSTTATSSSSSSTTSASSSRSHHPRPSTSSSSSSSTATTSTSTTDTGTTTDPSTTTTSSAATDTTTDAATSTSATGTGPTAAG